MSYAIDMGGGFAVPPWDRKMMRRTRRRGRRPDLTATSGPGELPEDAPEAGFPPEFEDNQAGPPRHHRHRGPGPGGPDGPGGTGRGGPWGPEFGRGFGPPRGPRGPRGRGGPWGPPGRRRDRGDVRAAVLLLLDEQPRHGYEILTELADRSDGQWRVSPGSVYPVLKRLTREGLVEPSHEDGRRVFSLTDAGRELVNAEREKWGEPWAQTTSPTAAAATELWDEGRQLAAAVWQVGQLNDPDQIEAATKLLTDARKAVYRLLADE